MFGKNQQPQAPPDFAVSAPMKQRIAQLTGADGGSPLFTSDLSVNEFLLVTQAGFEPLGLVVGSSMYHIGFVTPAGWTESTEVTSLSQAMYTARELAMTRMEEEAHALGADGIVGMRLEVGRYDWCSDGADFMAVGTAVRHRERQPFRTRHGKPFTSDLSGQDFAVLISMGYSPLGLVMGTCVYHVAHQTWKQAWATAGQNVEIGAFTQAIYDARELAMERMQAEAKELGAQGIVGVRIEEKSQGWDSHVIEFLAIGTAIARNPAAKGEPPTLVLPVTG